MATKKLPQGRGAAKGRERDTQGEGYERIDQYDAELVKRIGGHYIDILKAVGEDPKREGLLKTPERFSRALSNEDELAPARVA